MEEDGQDEGYGSTQSATAAPPTTIPTTAIATIAAEFLELERRGEAAPAAREVAATDAMDAWEANATEAWMMMCRRSAASQDRKR